MWLKVVSVIAGAAALLVVLVCAFFLVNRPAVITIDAEMPRDFPSAGFAHDTFERLLRKYVDASGNVDFEAWHGNVADRRMLDSYLAAVDRFSPEVTPERFPQKSDQLAYWMFGYNGYVIKSVLDHWPIDSVTDVKAPIEAVTGLGFFYRQRFHFGGRPLSLYAVENDMIRQSFPDPRIHFVLYCASASCPPLRPELPTGDSLEQMLDEATIAFVSDPNNVNIDHDQRQIVLSAIFEMYSGDFLRDLTRRGLASQRGVIDYVTSVAPESLQSELRAASDYEIRFTEYDWSIRRKK